MVAKTFQLFQAELIHAHHDRDGLNTENFQPRSDKRKLRAPREILQQVYNGYPQDKILVIKPSLAEKVLVHDAHMLLA